jgi:predicted peroxiredoxin
VWLTGEATWLALPGRAEQLELPHAPPLHELRDLLLDQATLTVCTQCAARRGIGPDDVLPGARIAGAATFVDEVLGSDAQALVY